MNPLTNTKNLQKLNQKELELGLSGGSSSWHNGYNDSAWIFIGGLPYDLTEGDIITVFSQYGEVVNINLVRDKVTGKQKGYAFICYEDQRSSTLAVDNLNSIKILNRTIRVDHVKNYRVPEGREDEDELSKKIRTEGCGPDVKIEKFEKLKVKEKSENDPEKKSKTHKKDDIDKNDVELDEIKIEHGNNDEKEKKIDRRNKRHDDVVETRTDNPDRRMTSKRHRNDSDNDRENEGGSKRDKKDCGNYDTGRSDKSDDQRSKSDDGDDYHRNERPKKTEEDRQRSDGKDRKYRNTNDDSEERDKTMKMPRRECGDGSKTTKSDNDEDRCRNDDGRERKGRDEGRREDDGDRRGDRNNHSRNRRSDDKEMRHGKSRNDDRGGKGRREEKDRKGQDRKREYKSRRDYDHEDGEKGGHSRTSYKYR